MNEKAKMKELEYSIKLQMKSMIMEYLAEITSITELEFLKKSFAEIIKQKFRK